MTQEESQTIEVEVVEIDGVTPPPPTAHAHDESTSRGAPWSEWQKWPTHVRKLDARWWPLWVLLGIFALCFALTIGLVLGVIFIIARMIRNLLRAVFSLFAPVGTTSLR